MQPDMGGAQGSPLSRAHLSIGLRFHNPSIALPPLFGNPPFGGFYFLAFGCPVLHREQ